MFKKIAIMGRHEDPRVSEPMTVLADYLAQAGIEVLAAEDMSLAIAATRIPESELADAADLIIAIGGDGAMLYAGQLARRGDLPLLGINRGRLGFLADVTPEEMLDSVGHVLAGEFTTDKRLVLEARLERPDEPDTTALALNDVVLQRRETGRMLDFVTRVSGRFVNTHAGDGLVIATDRYPRRPRHRASPPRTRKHESRDHGGRSLDGRDSTAGQVAGRRVGDAPDPAAPAGIRFLRHPALETPLGPRFAKT
jgi:NAD+ kinase